MTRKTKHELWAERTQAFLASGLSQRAWCEEHGLRANQLGYWLRKFEAETNSSSNNRWVNLDAIAPAGSGVSLNIPVRRSRGSGGD